MEGPISTTPSNCNPATLAQNPCWNWRDCVGIGSTDIPLRACYITPSNEFGYYQDDTGFELPIFVNAAEFRASDHPAVIVSHHTYPCFETWAPHLSVYYQCDWNPNSFYADDIDLSSCRVNQCFRIDDLVLVTNNEVREIMGEDRFWNGAPEEEQGESTAWFVAAAPGLGGGVVLLLVIWCICQSNNCKHKRPTGIPAPKPGFETHTFFSISKRYFRVLCSNRPKYMCMQNSQQQCPACESSWSGLS